MSNQVTAVSMDNYGKARAQMLIRHPFFASVVLSTEFIEDHKCETAWTDYIKVGYNPAFMSKLSIPVCTFVIIHEIMHIILKHNLRRGSRKPIRWNKAADYAINNELKDSGIEVWEHCLVDTRFHGMAAEQIYDILTEEADKKNEGRGKGEPGKGEPGKGEPGKGEPGKGEPGGGQGPDDDDDIEDLGPMGQDLKPDACEGMTQAEASAASQDINGKIAQAATMARAAGKMPANLDLLVNGILNPPQRWEAILREFMTRMVYSNETWNRRNRRFTVTLPSRIDAGMGELCIIGDTSGSMMGDKVYAQLQVEINHCVEFVRPERTRVVWADYAACTAEEVFEPGDEILLHPKGGGGTDMRLPLKFMEKYDPCCVILVTDCETPWPDAPTPFPLIVCSTTKQKSPEWCLRLDLR
jgi:predicted metal-dependent peptidase